MFDESPSVWGKILVNLRNIIQSSTEFKDIDVYFDDSEMNPTVHLPCISFKVGKKQLLPSSSYCTEYNRRLEIRLHTKTIDKRELQEELYKYEEDLVRVLNNARLSNQLLDCYEIVEDESSPLMNAMFNARKEGNQTDMTFFSNLIKLFFNVRYTI